MESKRIAHHQGSASFTFSLNSFTLVAGRSEITQGDDYFVQQDSSENDPEDGSEDGSEDGPEDGPEAGSKTFFVL
jgi:uncharacterized sporulation protein YeaH/YhbH (DUF444 family)